MAESRWLGFWLAVEAIAVGVAETLGRDDVGQPGLELLQDLLLLIGPVFVKVPSGHLLSPFNAKTVLLLTLGMMGQI